MNRSLIALSLLAILALAACTTTTATPPTVQGTVSSISNGQVTVTPANGQPVTLTVNRSTRVWWSSGIEAGRSDLVVGHRVEVWQAEGSQTASRIVIR